MSGQTAVSPAPGPEPIDLTFNATDQRWRDADGNHQPGNTNVVVGRLDLTEFRNFFVSDLAGLPAGASVLSATLGVFNGPRGYDSAEPTETYNLYEVTGSAATVTSGSNSLAVFVDLGDGTSHGSHVASASDNNTTVEIELNAAGRAATSSSAVRSPPSADQDSRRCCSVPAARRPFSR